MARYSAEAYRARWQSRMAGTRVRAGSEKSAQDAQQRQMRHMQQCASTQPRGQQRRRDVRRWYALARAR